MNRYHIAFGLVVGFSATAGLFGMVDYPAYIQAPFVSLFLAVWLFTAGIHAKQMHERKLLDGFLRWVYAPLVVVVILVDVIFNATWGTVIFREPPREFLFTNRVKRHMRDSIGKELEAAKTWANRLNAIDPGHV